MLDQTQKLGNFIVNRDRTLRFIIHREFSSKAMNAIHGEEHNPSSKLSTKLMISCTMESSYARRIVMVLRRNEIMSMNVI